LSGAHDRRRALSFSRFTAKKDGKVVTVTFVPASAKPLEAAAITALESAGAVFRDGGFLVAVAIEGDSDKSKAKTLLDLLVVK